MKCDFNKLAIKVAYDAQFHSLTPVEQPHRITSTQTHTQPTTDLWEHYLNSRKTLKYGKQCLVVASK